MLLASIPEKKIVSTQTGLADRTTIGTLVRSSFLRNRQKLGEKRRTRYCLMNAGRLAVWGVCRLKERRSSTYWRLPSRHQTEIQVLV